ncbi:hypothetical protein ACGFMK_24300 [Amycolatopsis sp. NPDC049252]|uniref:hypothetical protein n=1 Tax=Amycolatopsis sp. NPDC049252 TaxID=3363933 RepID=UPI00371F71C3
MLTSLLMDRLIASKAKLGNILFSQELHQRFHLQGISAAAFHPGTVATKFVSDAAGYMKPSPAATVLRLGC